MIRFHLLWLVIFSIIVCKDAKQLGNLNITKDFTTIIVNDFNEPELIVDRMSFNGRFSEFHSAEVVTWCREHPWISFLSCVCELKDIAMNLVQESIVVDGKMKTSLTRLADVYTHLDQSALICIAGEYSYNLLAASLLSSTSQTVLLFVSLNELSLTERDRFDQLLLSASNLKIHDVSKNPRIEFQCNMIHIRGTIRESVLNSLKIHWKDSTALVVEDCADRSSLSQMLLSIGIQVSWILKVGGETGHSGSGTTWFASTKLIKHHPFEAFRKKQINMEQQEEGLYAFRYLDFADITFHYHDWVNTVNERLYEKMRRNNYVVDIDYSSMVQENDKLFTGTRTDPSEVLLFVSFLYNGESIVPLHLEAIYDSVDGIIITEARMTHSGKMKEQLYIHKHARIFEPYLDKIQFLVIESFPSPPEDWQQLFQTKVLSAHIYDRSSRTVEEYYEAWFRENYQRDLVSDFLDLAFPNNSQKYILIVADADEIVGLFTMTAGNLKFGYSWLQCPYFVTMQMFYYNFEYTTGSWSAVYMINNVGVSSFYPLSVIRNADVVRVVYPVPGWHLSFFGSVHSMTRKIESFAHIEYDADTFSNAESLAESVMQGKDVFGRDGYVTPYLNWSTLPPLLQSYQPLILRYQKDLYAHSHLLHARIWITVGESVDVSADVLVAAYGLEDALSRIGFDKVSVVSGVNLTEYRRVYASGSRDFNEDGLQLQIVMGEPAGQWLLPNYLLLGQNDNDGSCGAITTSFAAPVLENALRNSAVIVDENGMEISTVSVVAQYVDVLFFGNDEMASQVLASNNSLNVLTSQSVDESGVLHMSNAATREHFIRHTKVVVISFASQATVDFVWINYLLSLGKCIVLVDNSPDGLLLSSEYAEVVLVVHLIGDGVRGVYSAYEALVADHERRAVMEQRATEAYERIQSNVKILKTAVLVCLDNSVNSFV